MKTMYQTMKGFMAYTIISLVAVTTMSSCTGSDDELITTTGGAHQYEISFSAWEGNINQINEIVDAYDNVLNGNAGTYTLSGTEEECEKEISMKAKIAESQLSEAISNGHGTMEIINKATNKSIYAKTFNATANSKGASYEGWGFSLGKDYFTLIGNENQTVKVRNSENRIVYKADMLINITLPLTKGAYTLYVGEEKVLSFSIEG